MFGMKDKDLYQQILGITTPWFVKEVDLNIEKQQVTIFVEYKGNGACPECGTECNTHDHRERQWRHLDTCQMKTILSAKVPRVNCKEHGVKQVSVPWAESKSRFTALFEALVIDWLMEASVSAVSTQLRLTWDEVDGIRGRAVARGLERRASYPVKDLGVDETSYQKHHEYVTIITDQNNGTVLEVLEDRKKETLCSFLETMGKENLMAIQSFSMDMWPAFIEAVKENLPNADEKICFDRFHISQHLGKAVDKVRAKEHKEFIKAHGESPLLRTKHDWLKNSERVDNRTRRWFMELTKSNLKTARAWAMKESVGKLWHYNSRRWAEKKWKYAIQWMRRSRLPAMVKVGKTIKDHLWGILNAVTLGKTNAIAESKNAQIQKVKRMACGFRNRSRFREAILFHLGGLDLYPSTARNLTPSHPKT